MRIAIQEGRKAIEKCSPNPPVGCVLVKAGKIIATGHTNKPGQPHAEAMALNQLQGDLDEVTAFCHSETLFISWSYTILCSGTGKAQDTASVYRHD